MPFNGSGTFSVPNTFEPGKKILSSPMNGNFTDIAQGLSQVLTRDGQAGMTAPLPGIGGSASAPGYTFIGDTDTGLYRSGANALGVATGGTARLTVDASGHVRGTAGALLWEQLGASADVRTFLVANDKAGMRTALDFNAAVTTIVNAAITQAFDLFVPIGTIMYYTANNLPSSNWYYCRGEDISRANFSRLFSVIGTTYGSGDGSTTFNLPNIQGLFIRGYDSSGSVDPARAFGSTQLDEFKAHTHTYTSMASVPAVGGTTNAGYTPSSATNTSSAGGTETRPKNIALLPLIRVS